jgi:hypothetical protein
VLLRELQLAIITSQKLKGEKIKREIKSKIMKKIIKSSKPKNQQD